MDQQDSPDPSDLRDPEDSRDRQGPLATREQQGQQDSLVLQETGAPTVCRDRTGPPVYRGLWETQDPRAALVYLVNQGCRAAEDPQGQRGLEALPDRAVSPGLLDLLVQRDPLVPQETRVLLDPQVFRDNQDFKAPPVTQDPWVLLVTQATRDHLVSRVFREPRAGLVPPDRVDLWGPPVTLE